MESGGCSPSPRPSQLLWAFARFFRCREVGEGYVDFAASNRYPLAQAFRVDLIPKWFRDDGFKGHPAPYALRLRRRLPGAMLLERLK